MTVESILMLGAAAALLVLLWLAFRPLMQERAERQRLSRLINPESDETQLTREPSTLRKRLMAAGLDVSPALVIAILLLIAAAFGLAMTTSFGGRLWVGIVAAVFAFWLCSAAIAEAARWRLWRFEHQFVESVELTAGALAAGEETTNALEHAAGASEEPAKSEVLRFAERLRSGMPVEAAVRPMVQKYDCEATRLFSQLLVAKWETGGQLAPALKDISRTVRTGLRLRRQLYTSISGAQMAGLIVAALPYLLLLVFVAERPDAIARMWAYAYGPQLFFAAVLLQIAGLVWLRRLLRTEL